MKTGSTPSLAIGCFMTLVLIPPMASAQATSKPQPQTPQPLQPPAQQVISPPFISAQTGIVSSKTVTLPPSATLGGLTLGQSQAQHETSVSVKIRFFKAPPAPYEVQCFFMAKNEAAKIRYIFNVAKHQSTEATDEIEFHSGALLGTTSNWIALPFGTPAPGANANDLGNLTPGAAAGLVVNSDAKQGSKMEGWILRVVCNGQVLKVESNQPYLLEMAKRLERPFDDAAKNQ
jgi:hypothetical protein